MEINFYEKKSPQLKQILPILGGKTRIDILKLINEKDYTITQLAKKLDCTLGNITQQVNKLQEAGFVLKHSSNTIGKNVKIVRPIYDKIIINFSKE